MEKTLLEFRLLTKEKSVSIHSKIEDMNAFSKFKYLWGLLEFRLLSKEESLEFDNYCEMFDGNPFKEHGGDICFSKFCRILNIRYYKSELETDMNITSVRSIVGSRC